MLMSMSRGPATAALYRSREYGGVLRIRLCVDIGAPRRFRRAGRITAYPFQKMLQRIVTVGHVWQTCICVQGNKMLAPQAGKDGRLLDYTPHLRA